jgi:hypothetical protein
LRTKLPPYDPTKRVEPKPAGSSPALSDAPVDANIVQLPKAGDPALGEKIRRETQRIYIMEDARRDYGR